MKFKDINQLAYFTAETVIHKEFEKSKSFPKDWDYVITEEEAKHIPQKNIKEEVMGDLPRFNEIVIQMIHRRLDWLFAEGFTIEEEDKYRFLSDQEMKEEVDKILSE